ncbi:hypothetical protein MTO98_19690 [Mucilaginibacter sp. SMC90]|uniref:hypothetical protein n=1 Tax=Mucilaginibacter sp. SMC90 TaxID=2929803 RepID=UPI001FB38BDE|nr:hypothetical protein [Mucilaginibacter sp. SMC90]UOE46630.1 hypothetical protein MTO98_19690 [Mucilaginibacter sp. SMC90]
MAVINVSAQDKTKTIGNKPRSGSSNNTFNAVKGAQVGIEMNAGKKQVQLLTLNFHTQNRSSDSIPFKVNVYQMAGKFPNEANLVKDEIKGYIKKYDSQESHQLTTVDLSPYNVKVAGDIVVSIEFLTTRNGSNIGFACGLFNGGTFHKDGETEPWKKIPVVGADFNVLVKKLK